MRMAHWPTQLTPLDRFLGRFTQLRPGEGRSVVAFFSYALLMMVSYYILKTIREPLLLTRYVTGFFLLKWLAAGQLVIGRKLSCISNTDARGQHGGNAEIDIEVVPV